MKEICSRHSHDLRAALKKKGLGGLISTTEAESVRKARMWLAGSLSGEPFDPYVVASLEIFNKARSMFGGLLHDDCPLCEACRVLQKAEVDGQWVDNVSDLMLATALVNEWVKPLH